MRFFVQRKRGLSLVEMLIILGVIALLATVVLANISNAKKKARDTQRISDIQQIQLALRLYRDANGRYPDAGCGGASWVSPGPGTAVWYTECSEYISGLVPDYLPKLPIDPIYENNPNAGYMYLVTGGGSGYKLLVHATAEKGVINKGEPFARCPASCVQAYCSQPSYAVYSSGTACW